MNTHIIDLHLKGYWYADCVRYWTLSHLNNQRSCIHFIGVVPQVSLHVCAFWSCRYPPKYDDHVWTSAFAFYPWAGRVHRSGARLQFWGPHDRPCSTAGPTQAWHVLDGVRCLVKLQLKWSRLIPRGVVHTWYRCLGFFCLPSVSIPCLNVPWMVDGWMGDERSDLAGWVMGWGEDKMVIIISRSTSVG